MRQWCQDGLFTRDTLSPDGTHMADPGYRLLGEALGAWLIARA
jgi:lysophospholipase L1-like esterase